MNPPSLQFHDQPYHPNDLQNLLLQFQERGFVVLRNVFQRETVDAYREEIKGSLQPDADGRLHVPDDSPLNLWPTRAPRLRQILSPALSHASMKPHASLFEIAWLISPSGPPISVDKGWHKDRDHEPMPGREYHYPRDIHIGLYLDDMTPEHGPTEVIPRSHRDPALSPFSGAPVEAFLCRKEDIVLWDQRLWHRGTSRTLPGLRIFGIFGFYAVPVYGPDRREMKDSQRAAWLNAEEVAEQVFYGGPFLPRRDE